MSSVAASSPRPKAASRNPPGGPVKLNRRMLRMIDLMVNGHPDDPSRTRYGAYDAAQSCGYHRRAARALARSPLFVDAYYRALAGDKIDHLAPTLEQLREGIAKQDAARRYRAHRAGYVEYAKPVAQS